MEKERRREERIRPAHQPKGKFTLHVGNQSFDVRAVIDTSPFGFGLQIDNHIKNRTIVRLKYQLMTVKLEVNGAVVWSSSVDKGPPGYLLGISLRAEDLMI